MRKFISIVLVCLVLTMAGVATMMFISMNNHSNTVNTVNTVSATVAPTEVSATEAPVLPVATFAPFAPVATATVAPVATSAPAAVATAPAVTSAPAPVATAHVQMSSLDVSKKTIVTDDEGNFRQMMIRSVDLPKVDYDEIVIDVWDGVKLNVNTSGIVGEIFNREDNSNAAKRAGVRDGNLVKGFFTNGEVKSEHVREGYAVPDTEIGTYDLTNIRFVQIMGEENYRLVIAGNSHNGGNGGKADPTATVTSAPTQEPTQPTSTPTPAPAADDTPPVPRETVTPNPIHNPTSTPTPAPATGDAPADPTEKVTHGVRHNGYDEEAAEPAVEETPEPPVFESSAEAPAEEIEQVIPVEATGDVPDAPI